VAETGDALQDVYYGGEGGISFFLDTLLAHIERDPRFMPTAEELAYVDTVLARAASTLDTPAEERIATWQADRATLTLDWMHTLDGTHLNTGLSVTTEVLPCAWISTIWSQPAQSYSQVVDFGGSAGTVLPVGASEARADASFLAELDNWTEGRLKPAPLSPADVAAVTVATETLWVP
jgi:hypothetical protein